MKIDVGGLSGKFNCSLCQSNITLTLHDASVAENRGIT